MAFVYLLHFETPLSHAYHYGGATTELRRRLAQHANGQGSAITRALIEKEIEWILAALWTCQETEVWAFEKIMKRGHQQSRFCPVCRPDPHLLAGATPVDIGLVPFPITSLELRNGTV